MKKTVVIIIVLSILALVFVDRCTTANLTTADVFRPSFYDDFNELPNKPQSKNYEIIPVKGTFPILFDDSRSEFYVKNGQGFTKYDNNGNIIVSNDLSKEKYTSMFDFANFVPYVFAENGVYDYTGKDVTYSKFSKIINAKNEIRGQNFKSLFETNYRDAKLVIYDTDRNLESGRDCYPMYFQIDGQWTLMFSQKDDFQFSHLGADDIKNDTIGQIDYLGFPAKLSDKRLMVLKDVKNEIYSINQMGKEKVTDKYLATYYTQILKEKSMDYHSDNHIKLLAHKKDEYYSTGNPFDMPQWISPSFINTGYFELFYNGEKINFIEKAVKINGEKKIQNDMFLYELPKNLRSKSKIAFLYYGLDIGGYRNETTDSVEPIIKNAGLYLVRKK